MNRQWTPHEERMLARLIDEPIKQITDKLNAHRAVLGRPKLTVEAVTEKRRNMKNRKNSD